MSYYLDNKLVMFSIKRYQNFIVEKDTFTIKFTDAVTII